MSNAAFALADIDRLAGGRILTMLHVRGADRCAARRSIGAARCCACGGSIRGSLRFIALDAVNMAMRRSGAAELGPSIARRLLERRPRPRSARRARAPSAWPRRGGFGPNGSRSKARPPSITCKPAAMPGPCPGHWHICRLADSAVTGVHSAARLAGALPKPKAGRPGPFTRHETVPRRAGARVDCLKRTAPAG
jgi:hypothetical protein